MDKFIMHEEDVEGVGSSGIEFGSAEAVQAENARVDRMAI
jgi:hypothetical protein